MCEIPRSATEISAALRLKSAQSISDWRLGRAIPSPNIRTRIHTTYGIPPRAWGMPAGAPSAAIVASNDTAPELMAHCVELLSALRADRREPGIGAAVRLRIAATEARLLQIRQQFEAKAELAEDRYVREHPAWRRARALVVDALRDHPAAAKAVVRALERAGV